MAAARGRAIGSIALVEMWGALACTPPPQSGVHPALCSPPNTPDRMSFTPLAALVELVVGSSGSGRAQMLHTGRREAAAVE